MHQKVFFSTSHSGIINQQSPYQARKFIEQNCKIIIKPVALTQQEPT